MRRSDVDLTAGTVRVPRNLAALRNGMEFGPPKSAAGNRTVTLPAAARTVLADHLAAYVGEGPKTLAFTGDKGAVLRSGNFRRAVGWASALRAAGMPAGFHFHDLRHTGNNLAAATGASTRDLMHRMGHASMRAALVYQHANGERDREIAYGMDRRITKQAKRAAATARSSEGKGETSKVKASDAQAKASKGKPAKRNATEAKPAARRPVKGTKAARPARGPVSGGTAGLLARQWHARSKTASTRTAQARRVCR
ncbi:tyrosine-type recombinase/integrase [Micromonospora sp. WMMD714]|uniref:tyrosine-type recombinase/integrase n=1 Tax=Micromonospora sp. WMMD714 TaxID=3016097 RepID=UPI00249C9274|nr:tyrosine-type recombinase/integrase [Micromonospora sp. WMMD714]WFE61907.1 tyrosine-type recombinase/integrase [Micromonospora sp. WMMD714]